MRSLPSVALMQEIRVAVRMARRAPAATVGLLVTMAVATAGCATAFAVVNAVLLRPFPFAAPERLVHVEGTDAKGANRLLSMAGLYGLTAHAIGQSTREIGIRKALGATDGIVTNLFLTRVVLVIIPALSAGMLASISLLRVIRAEIDGLTFEGLWWLAATCGALFALVCVAAVYLPLRRIRSVDPALSMRAE